MAYAAKGDAIRGVVTSASETYNKIIPPPPPPPPPPPLPPSPIESSSKLL
ncbi:hypothetical protein DFP73DRAFT_594709 [Morchella snyderi]|nr:hypothetical protein DFP73DRAFT_594709 [Morchella snyderi]